MIYLTGSSTVTIEVKVLDLAVVPAIPFSPSTVSIYITDSAGTLVVDNAPMTLSSVVGYYSYSYTLPTTGPIGAFTALVTATQGIGRYAKDLGIVFVKLSSGDTFPATDVFFEYFAVKDSDSVPWYWSIITSSILGSDAYFTLTTTLPTDVYLAATSITPATVPFSLKATDELGGLVYIYPNTLGEIVVDTDQPAGATQVINTGLRVKGRDSVYYTYKGLSYLSAELVAD